MARTPWGSGRLVVLAGAGISAVPPSDVPSWWHFNEAVLERILRLARRGFELEPEQDDALAAITLDVVGVALFSDVVVECIAGTRWFRLLRHLDGTTPAPCHEALAQLAAAGRLAAIVTTNFDTLIEQAFANAGVPLNVVVPGAMPPAQLDEGQPCQLVKLHGSAADAGTLVDLASQKLRGLAVGLQRWLGRLFAEHAVLVTGFSGADLELGEDYLGLVAGAEHTPWLRWTTRAGRAPLPIVAEVVGAARDGALVEGELPDVLAEVGLTVPASRPTGAASTDPAIWIDEWLQDVAASPHAAAAMGSRLLDIAGREQAATAVRATVRDAIVAAMRKGVSIVEALQAAHALALFGSDEVQRDPQSALGDLTLARSIIEGC